MYEIRDTISAISSALGGLSSVGRTIVRVSGGGVGEMVAEWIVEGEPSLDLWPFDIRRFNDHHNTKEFLYPRTVESYGKTYHVHYPGEEHESARGIRKSPLYDTLKESGAVYGSKAGWERPNWFDPGGDGSMGQGDFMRPAWHDHTAREHKAVRERVALIDQCSFSKFVVSGPGALKTLQTLAVSDMDKPVGKIIYTQFCNERGGIEADLTVSRLAEDSFYIVTGSAFGGHDKSWITGHAPDDGSVTISDLTDQTCVINLCGPDARKVLQKCCADDVSNAALPFATFKDLDLAGRPVRAHRIGYVGELGWELHMANEHGLAVYQALKAAGEEFNIADVGYKAIDTLRMEKGYLYWSGDLTPDYNPYEAGLGFRVNLKKGGFIGREALVQAREEGVKRKLSMFTLDRPAAVYGGETIMRGGQVLDVTTSANFGHSIGKPIVFGYLPIEQCVHNDFEIEAFGETYAATRHDGPLYDPGNEKLKS